MTRYDPNLTVLVDGETGKPVSPGDRVTSFRGEVGVLDFARASDGLNGKVYVRWEPRKDGPTTSALEYNPSVFGLVYVAPDEVSA